MSTIDKAMIGISGLKLHEVAGILGKSRQAIDRGVRNEKKYFRSDDVKKIYVETCAKRPHNQRELAEYIRRQYSEFADLIVTAAGADTFESVADAAEEIVMSIHDVEQFRFDLPAPFEKLMRVVSRGGLKVVLFTSSIHSENYFSEYLTLMSGELWRHNSVHTYVKPFVRHMPITIIFDVYTRDRPAKAFVVSLDDIVPLGDFQARRLAANVQDFGAREADETISDYAQPYENASVRAQEQRAKEE